MSEAYLEKIQNEEIAALSLNEEQIPEYKAINKDFTNGVKALRNSDEDRNMRFDQMRELSENRDDELKDLLTEVQFEKY